MRYTLTLNYNGSGFRGWQIQPDEPSVQGTVEKALGVLLKAPVCIVGAGRTDTGVNASAYVAHFDFDSKIDCALICRKLNAILPDSVSVSSMKPVPDDFHARFSAAMREYKYFLHRKKDPFVQGWSWQCSYPVLDFEAMNKAAEQLKGVHDFSCFEKTGADNKTSTCVVYEAYWHRYTPPVATPDGEYWFFRIVADRFLRNMVRAIVGTLIEVGRGKRSVEDFASLILPPEALEQVSPELEPVGKKKRTASRRNLAGESVPGYALFLTGVKY